MSDGPRPTDVNLRDAYDAIVADPDGDHAPGTTLAPVYDALTGPSDASEVASRLERYLPLATSVVDVETGPGRLLAAADSFPTVVGTESRHGLRRRAAGRGQVVAATPTALPVQGVDAVGAFDFVTAGLDEAAFESFVRSAHEALSPGGTLLFDALVTPAGIDGGPTAVSDGTVEARRERRVTATPAGASVEETYELIDAALEDSVTVERTVPYRTYDPAIVWETLSDVGFEDVMLTTREVGDGAVLVVADKAGQVAPDGLS